MNDSPALKQERRILKEKNLSLKDQNKEQDNRLNKSKKNLKALEVALFRARNVFAIKNGQIIDLEERKAELEQEVHILNERLRANK